MLGRQQLSLTRIWSHPRHSRIVFDEPSHTYTVDGRKLKGSVTGLVGNCFPPFDTDAKIEGMMTGKNWPREQYSDDVDGVLVPWSKERIKKSWEDNKNEKAALGTDLHAKLERYFLGASVSLQMDAPNATEFAMGVLWWERMKKAGFSIFAVEALLWGGGHVNEPGIEGSYPRIAGSCDLLLRHKDDPEDVVHVVDHKRCLTSGPFFKQSRSLAAPLTIPRLSDCKHSHWEAQANVYAHLLSDYGLRVASMAMVVHHVDTFPNSKVFPMRHIDVSPLLALPPENSASGTTVIVTERLPAYAEGVSVNSIFTDSPKATRKRPRIFTSSGSTFIFDDK